MAAHLSFPSTHLPPIPVTDRCQRRSSVKPAVETAKDDEDHDDNEEHDNDGDDDTGGSLYTSTL